MLKHALKLMQVHEDELGTTYLWNFHMGYAWYYLDQESRALPHFRRALELNTGDDSRLNSRQGIEDLTDDCEKRISLPRFEQCFRERTETTWEAFAKQESQMRYLMGCLLYTSKILRSRMIFFPGRCGSGRCGQAFL